MKVSDIQLLTQISLYNVRVWIKLFSPLNSRDEVIVYFIPTNCIYTLRHLSKGEAPHVKAMPSPT